MDMEFDGNNRDDDDDDGFDDRDDDDDEGGDFIPIHKPPAYDDEDIDRDDFVDSSLDSDFSRDSK